MDNIPTISKADIIFLHIFLWKDSPHIFFLKFKFKLLVNNKSSLLSSQDFIFMKNHCRKSYQTTAKQIFFNFRMELYDDLEASRNIVRKAQLILDLPNALNVVNRKEYTFFSTG